MFSEGGMMMKMNELICFCKGVTRGSIVDAIRKGASTVKAIQNATGAGTGNRCKELNPKGVCCIPDIKVILETETGKTDNDSSRCSCCCSKTK
jgi:NAD(P)H-nitrite reductase large subunit